MNQVANEALQQVKQALANATTHKPATPTTQTTPDFTKMSCAEAVRWCRKQGIDKPKAIANLTGKPVNSVYTALWKVRHPKLSKKMNREYKARTKKAKSLVVSVKKTKPTTTQKPKIENGLYEDGMETPMFDAIMRRGVSGFVKPRSLELAKQWLAKKEKMLAFAEKAEKRIDDALIKKGIELEAENRRLKILVEHYEALLFAQGGN